jgi:alkylated DNA repair dioxygenase AlkB
LADEIITPDEEAVLSELIDNCCLKYVEQGDDGRRSTTSFGWAYRMASDDFIRCDPIPPGFSSVREKAARFAAVAPEDLLQVVLNRYEGGATIPPHFDKPFFDEIIGISLGAPSVMHFTRESDSGTEHAQVVLSPRSIYLMSGPARHEFKHSVPPVAGVRRSITFRTLSAMGKRIAQG